MCIMETFFYSLSAGSLRIVSLLPYFILQGTLPCGAADNDSFPPDSWSILAGWVGCALVGYLFIYLLVHSTSAQHQSTYRELSFVHAIQYIRLI